MVAEDSPEDLTAKQNYAQYLVAERRYTKAIPLLEELARVTPMRGLEAAVYARLINNETTAKRIAETTLVRLDRLVADDPANSDLHLGRAQVQLFLKRYAESVRSVDTSIKSATTEARRHELRQFMGELIVTWAKSLNEADQRDEDSSLRVLKMLQVALQYAPSNAMVLSMVSDQVLATVEEEDKQINALRESLIRGISPGISHFIRGTSALLAGEDKAANLHLEIAARHLPNSSVVLNNLAVAMSKNEQADLQQALHLSEKAISLTNTPSAHYFETRGQILFQMNAYRRAIPDLERALALASARQSAHAALAVCYRETGQIELSRQHRIRAEHSP